MASWFNYNLNDMIRTVFFHTHIEDADGTSISGEKQYRRVHTYEWTLEGCGPWMSLIDQSEGDSVEYGIEDIKQTLIPEAEDWLKDSSPDEWDHEQLVAYKKYLEEFVKKYDDEFLYIEIWY